jgi:D-beta-D-heptose 7-phosphate kinase/D-beta-D-heptose 1-phosphate adenosyltransferase
MQFHWDDVLRLLEGGFSAIRVLVVGDILLERYLVGEVAGMAPHWKVPVLRQMRRYERPGGAANVAMNLAALGCETSLCGLWGRDGEQADLARLLGAAKVDMAGVTASSLPTAARMHIVAGSRPLLSMELNAGGAVPAEETARLEARTVELVKKVHAVVLVDGEGGALTGDVCMSVLRAARTASIPVVADPCGPDLSRFSGAMAICPSLDELVLATGVGSDDQARLMAAARMQMVEHEFKVLAIPLREKGVRAIGPEGETYAPGSGREVFDAAGADDAVVAMLAAGLAGGLDTRTTVRLASAAADTVLGKMGVVAVSRVELIAAVRGLLSEGSES